jgi:hypothetical protein
MHLVALVCVQQRTEEVDMSIRRLIGTSTAMALIAGALASLTPGVQAMAATLAAAQRTADIVGPDALVVSAVGLLAWAVWAWGALGLTLTAAAALPGMLGGAARGALHVVLPAGARRSAALALGLGLGVAGPLFGTAALMAPTPAAAAVPEAPASSAGTAPDWPVASPVAAPDPVPDWPDAASASGTHVVVRGECLWQIAGDRLLAQQGRTPTDGEVAAVTHAWWRANAAVIGPDPDLLLPGQVLSPPGPT